jgi:hypothetical protein
MDEEAQACAEKHRPASDAGGRRSCDLGGASLAARIVNAAAMS